MVVSASSLIGHPFELRKISQSVPRLSAREKHLVLGKVLGIVVPNSAGSENVEKTAKIGNMSILGSA